MTTESRAVPVVTVANQAGSVGKSTIVAALAPLLAAEGKRVLVWDLDAQANVTRSLGVDPDAVGVHTGDVLLKRNAWVGDAIVASPIDNVWIVPGNEALAVDVIELQNSGTAALRLRAPLKEAIGLHSIDVVLLDCPGSVSLLTILALAASTAVITVTTPAVKELGGIAAFAATVAENASDLDVPISLDAIIPCSVPPRNAGKVYAEAMDWLIDSYDGLVTPPIRRSAIVPEAASNGEPVTTYAPKEPVSEDLRAVLADLHERGVL